MIESGAALNDDEVILRTFDSKYRRANGTIRHDAFGIRKNGKDNNGLSVTRKAERSCGEVGALLNLESQKKLLCHLTPKGVRKLDFQPIEIGKLDVIASPSLKDPFHALIVGTPVFSSDRALQRRVAELLSDLAECC